MSSPRTLFEKIWDNHRVVDEPDAPTILYIDLHLVHEVTSPQAFQGLRNKGLVVRRPERTIATMDHSTPTTEVSYQAADELGARQLRQLEQNCHEFDVPLLGLDHPQRGIVHVIGPELGLTQPGMTIVCGDSHTATHGAFGALAFGIGTSEVEHVLATQTLLQDKPPTMCVEFQGSKQPGVTAKDLALALIAEMGVEGGTGYVIEYTGEAVKALDMEERMTLCNLTIEGGARAGMIAPDQTTFDYLYGKPFAPKGAGWDKALNEWQTLKTDPQASYDHHMFLNVSDLSPMVTFGTSPDMGVQIGEPVPDPHQISDPHRRGALEKALDYMGIQPGKPLLNHPVDVVFVGSCTNGRLSDLQAAAAIVAGKKVAPGVRMLIVPGSETVRRQAEKEGLDKIFKAAGGEWRYAGCSMCLAMNGDQLEPGQYAISTSNRNFEGRQGKGGRTILASPATAAAAAVTGKITDPREFLS